MNQIKVPPPAGWNGLSYPVGNNPEAVRTWAKAMAPALATLIAGKEEEYVFVCRGSSGAMLTTALNMVLNTPLPVVHVKKEGESSHQGLFNGPMFETLKRAPIIVDDHIATGATVRAIVEGFNHMRKDWSGIGTTRHYFAIVLANGRFGNNNGKLEDLAAVVTFDHYLDILT